MKSASWFAGAWTRPPRLPRGAPSSDRQVRASPRRRGPGASGPCCVNVAVDEPRLPGEGGRDARPGSRVTRCLAPRVGGVAHARKVRDHGGVVPAWLAARRLVPARLQSMWSSTWRARSPSGSCLRWPKSASSMQRAIEGRRLEGRRLVRNDGTRHLIHSRGLPELARRRSDFVFHHTLLLQ